MYYFFSNLYFYFVWLRVARSMYTRAGFHCSSSKMAANARGLKAALSNTLSNSRQFRHSRTGQKFTKLLSKYQCFSLHVPNRYTRQANKHILHVPSVAFCQGFLPRITVSMGIVIFLNPLLLIPSVDRFCVLHVYLRPVTNVYL